MKLITKAEIEEMKRLAKAAVKREMSPETPWYTDTNFITRLNPETVTRLLETIEEMRRVIEFYASQDSWSWAGYQRYVDTIMDDHDKAKASDGRDILLGGKRARDFIKKMEGGE